MTPSFGAIILADFKVWGQFWLIPIFNLTPALSQVMESFIVDSKVDSNSRLDFKPCTYQNLIDSNFVYSSLNAINCYSPYFSVLTELIFGVKFDSRVWNQLVFIPIAVYLESMQLLRIFSVRNFLFLTSWVKFWAPNMKKSSSENSPVRRKFRARQN